MAYTTTTYIQTLAYSRVTRPPHKRLKAYLCRGKKLKRLCVVWKQESPMEWTTFPLSCVRMETRQQQHSWQRYAKRSGRWRNCRKSGLNRSICRCNTISFTGKFHPPLWPLQNHHWRVGDGAIQSKQKHYETFKLIYVVTHSPCTGGIVSVYYVTLNLRLTCSAFLSGSCQGHNANPIREEMTG